MRDDQILTLIKRECAHNNNVSILGDQQTKLGLESFLEVIAERGCIIRTFFTPGYFRKRFEQVYTAKAAAFNGKIRSAVAREKLGI